MASALPNTPEEATRNLACFAVADQTFAIEVGYVREIVRLQTITPLPNAPRLIEGVIDLRGAVVPVVDLARLLRLEGKGGPVADDARRIVVLEFMDLVLGLRVDAATDVLNLDVRRFEDVPGLAAQAGYDAISHVIRQEDSAPVMVLSLETLVARVQASAEASAFVQTEEARA